jgi:drug/metabolite transporter (DMT)-like permease
MPFWLLLLAGLVLVVRPWDVGGALSGVLACASGIAWAGAALLVRLLQRRPHTDALSLAAWQMTTGAAGMGTLAVPMVGAVASWVQLGGRPDAVEAVGMALVVVALAVLAAHGVRAGCGRARPPA